MHLHIISQAGNVRLYFCASPPLCTCTSTSDYHLPFRSPRIAEVVRTSSNSPRLPYSLFMPACTNIMFLLRYSKPCYLPHQIYPVWLSAIPIRAMFNSMGSVTSFHNVNATNAQPITCCTCNAGNICAQMSVTASFRALRIQHISIGVLRERHMPAHSHSTHIGRHTHR